MYYFCTLIVDLWVWWYSYAIGVLFDDHVAIAYTYQVYYIYLYTSESTFYSPFNLTFLIRYS